MPKLKIVRVSPLLGISRGNRMAVKPTYEELEERIKKNEIETKSCKQKYEALRESADYMQAILIHTSQPIFIKTCDYKYIFINRQFEKLAQITNEKISGKTDFDVFPEQIAALFRFQDEEVKKLNTQLEFEETVPLKDGEVSFITFKFPLRNATGEMYAIGGVCTDITRLKQAELALRKAHDELEEKVKKRTADLEQQNQVLEETNIAMKVLMEQRKKDKKSLEEKMQLNVNKLILPSLERLSKNSVNIKQKKYIEIIENNLKEIIEPFSTELDDKLILLTPAEIQIANLIKQGKTTKEIAQLLNLSPATIATHRRKIRKKVGLTNKKLNLRTILTSNKK